jgi:enterochelin esterase-like enzyme
MAVIGRIAPVAAAFALTGAAPTLIPAAVASTPGRGEGPRVENTRLKTPNMPHPVKVKMWLPRGFDEAKAGSMPWIVFLHDGFGSERSFFRRGLGATLAKMIERGEVPRIAVACPRTVGTFNSNDRLGKRRMFDALTEDLIPFLLDRYPQLRRDVKGRGMTGISMGGYGTLKIALKRPALFGAVSALSPWVEDLSFERQRQGSLFMRWAMGRVFGRTAETSTIRGESLFVVLQGMSGSRGALPEILLITGQSDPSILDGSFVRLTTALDAAGARETSKRYPGKHDWVFWRSHIEEIVRYHATAFGEPAP